MRARTTLALPTLTGTLLFLFIPLVLVLYLRMPLGLAPSILLGVALMVGHRFMARPFMLRELQRRCFWCGGVVGETPLDASTRSRDKLLQARACSRGCRDSFLAFGRFVSAVRPVVALLIFVPIAVYLANAAVRIAGGSSIPIEVARWLFKVPIAIAVGGLSVAYPLGRGMTRPPAIDFPVHNLFLLGVRNTLWVFRLVGLWWLVSWVLWLRF